MPAKVLFRRVPSRFFGQTAAFIGKSAFVGKASGYRGTAVPQHRSAGSPKSSLAGEAGRAFTFAYKVVSRKKGSGYQESLARYRYSQKLRQSCS